MFHTEKIIINNTKDQKNTINIYKKIVAWSKIADFRSDKKNWTYPSTAEQMKEANFAHSISGYDRKDSRYRFDGLIARLILSLN